MQFLEKLKSVFGRQNGGERRRESVGVTVEREPTQGAGREPPVSASVPEPEPDEPATGDESSDTEEISVQPEADTDSVETISGIGPSYASRLAEAGIETVDQLVDVDPAELAAQTEIAEKRIAGWIDQASE